MIQTTLIIDLESTGNTYRLTRDWTRNWAETTPPEYIELQFEGRIMQVPLIKSLVIDKEGEHFEIKTKFAQYVGSHTDVFDSKERRAQEKSAKATIQGIANRGGYTMKQIEK